MRDCVSWRAFGVSLTLIFASAQVNAASRSCTAAEKQAANDQLRAMEADATLQSQIATRHAPFGVQVDTVSANNENVLFQNGYTLNQNITTDLTKAKEALWSYNPIVVGIRNGQLTIVPQEVVDQEVAVYMIASALASYVHLGEASFNSFDKIKVDSHLFEFGAPFGEWCKARGHLQSFDFLVQIGLTARQR
ncbi:hypothetical protein ACFO5Q_11735 [Kordiimonas lipolytica]|uniref:Uncharacterized protein n=1 Tax=Kordiimonas lipolytica TaxID=1662421 RepID=A0ABV8UDK9_9PROT|nr:hypothetical protein [Kordiimonas lipolytica]